MNDAEIERLQLLLNSKVARRDSSGVVGVIIELFFAHEIKNTLKIGRGFLIDTELSIASGLFSLCILIFSYIPKYLFCIPLILISIVAGRLTYGLYTMNRLKRTRKERLVSFMDITLKRIHEDTP